MFYNKSICIIASLEDTFQNINLFWMVISSKQRNNSKLLHVCTPFLTMNVAHYLCTHVHTFTHKHTNLHMHVPTYTHIFKYMHIHLYAHVLMFTHAHVFTCVNICMHVHMHIHIDICAYVNTCTYTLIQVIQEKP